MKWIKVILIHKSIYSYSSSDVTYVILEIEKQEKFNVIFPQVLLK